MTYSPEFYQRHKEKILARIHKYRDSHKEVIKVRALKYYYANKEYIKARRKEYYGENKAYKSVYAKAYRRLNKEKILERRRVYYLKNKERVDAKQKEYYTKNHRNILKKETVRRADKRQEALQMVMDAHNVQGCHYLIHPNMPEELKHRECWGMLTFEHPNGDGTKVTRSNDLIHLLRTKKKSSKDIMVLCQLHQIWNSMRRRH